MQSKCKAAVVRMRKKLVPHAARQLTSYPGM
jgi:hypothetical protein